MKNSNIITTLVRHWIHRRRLRHFELANGEFLTSIAGRASSWGPYTLTIGVCRSDKIRLQLAPSFFVPVAYRRRIAEYLYGRNARLAMNLGPAGSVHWWLRSDGEVELDLTNEMTDLDELLSYGLETADTDSRELLRLAMSPQAFYSNPGNRRR